MSSGPWAMSVMMQRLHPSATSGANSVMTPTDVMRAILAGADVNSVPSLNQRLPSEPLLMARGWLFAVATLNCFKASTGAAPAALPSDSARPAASATVIAHARSFDMSPSPSWPQRREHTTTCGPTQSGRRCTRTYYEPRPSLDLSEGKRRSTGGRGSKAPTDGVLAIFDSPRVPSFEEVRR